MIDDSAVQARLSQHQEAAKQRQRRYREAVEAADRRATEREARRQKILDEEGPEALLRAELSYAMSGGRTGPLADHQEDEDQ